MKDSNNKFVKNKNRDKEFEDIKYDIIGSAFLGNLIDMSGDIDNSGQNFAMYMENEDIKKIKNKK